MRCFGINLGVSLIWLFLSQAGIPSFVFGWLAGFALLAVFPKVLHSSDYVRRQLAFGRFLLVFLREFLHSNLQLMWAILLRSVDDMHPNFITYPVADLDRAEIFLLAHCISLTPGTTSVELEGDRLVIHAFNGADPDSIRGQIDRTLRKAILEFTR